MPGRSLRGQGPRPASVAGRILGHGGRGGRWHGQGTVDDRTGRFDRPGKAAGQIVKTVRPTSRNMKACPPLPGYPCPAASRSEGGRRIAGSTETPRGKRLGLIPRDRPRADRRATAPAPHAQARRPAAPATAPKLDILQAATADLGLPRAIRGLGGKMRAASRQIGRDLGIAAAAASTSGAAPQPRRPAPWRRRQTTITRARVRARCSRPGLGHLIVAKRLHRGRHRPPPEGAAACRPHKGDRRRSGPTAR